MFNLIVEKIAAENGRVKRRIENLPFSKEKRKSLLGIERGFVVS